MEGMKESFEAGELLLSKSKLLAYCGKQPTKLWRYVFAKHMLAFCGFEICQEQTLFSFCARPLANTNKQF